MGVCVCVCVGLSVCSTNANGACRLTLGLLPAGCFAMGARAGRRFERVWYHCMASVCGYIEALKTKLALERL